MADKHKECYQCGNWVTDLSPRSRCVYCEHSRAEFNAKENAQLRAVIDKLERNKQ